MSDLDLIDSYAIGALVQARKTAIDNDRAFQVVNVRGHPHRVMRIAGVLDALTDSTGDGAVG
jgi:anti-anti-sigma regulatory factor